MCWGKELHINWSHSRPAVASFGGQRIFCCGVAVILYPRSARMASLFAAVAVHEPSDQGGRGEEACLCLSLSVVGHDHTAAVEDLPYYIEVCCVTQGEARCYVTNAICCRLCKGDGKMMMLLLLFVVGVEVLVVVHHESSQ